jgi:hypothetical protein
MLGRSTLLAMAGALALTPAAQAQLPLPLPLPDLGGTVNQVTGAAGGLVPGATTPVADALDGLLGTLGLPPATGNRAGSAPAGSVLGAPGGVIDGRAPTVGVTVLSHLRVVRRTGRMVVRVTSSEASVVALSGTVRPGVRLRRYGHGRRGFRAPVRVARALLAFRRQGALRVTISLSRSAQKRLGQARDARLSLAVAAVDVARNQAARNVKRHVRR